MQVDVLAAAIHQGMLQEIPDEGFSCATVPSERRVTS